MKIVCLLLALACAVKCVLAGTCQRRPSYQQSLPSLLFGIYNMCSSDFEKKHFVQIRSFSLPVANMYVSAEFCDHDSDCKVTTCGPTFTLDCYDRDNVCTCIPPNSYFCNGTSAGCQTAHGPCTHGDHQWHCYDNVCRCRTFG